MESIENYLQIMIDSLIKKGEYLDRILEKNRLQHECIKDKEYEDVDWTVFNVLVAEKEAVIDRITEIDEGFSDIYERIREEVLTNKEKYRKQVGRLQEIINELTDKGVRIQAGEERNRKIIEGIFNRTRQEIKKQRTSINAASNYYKTMSNAVVRAAEDSILDQKK